MKWKKFTIQTTTAAEDFISEKLSEIGIEESRLKIRLS